MSINLERRKGSQNSRYHVLPDADFNCSPRQYKRRIEQWKLDKYIKEDDMKVILRKDLKRKREGKETDFTVAGRNVESQKIRKFAKRNNFTEEEILGFDVGMLITKVFVRIL